MSLALFDLDETLIGGNSPSLWSAYLGAQGWLDLTSFMAKEQALVAGYSQGTHTLEDYLQHTLEPLVGRRQDEVDYLANAFVEECIEPLIFSQGMHCIATHRAQGDRIVVISATPTFLVKVIAERLGIDEVLGTDLAQVNGFYTGQINGIGCAREGKIAKLENWLNTQSESLHGAHFYSDSRNDIPLLSHVDVAHAVNPDPVLHAHATANGWDILHWQ